MHDSVITVVLDAGARYGLHPTWKPFTGELLCFLFEPDPAEAARLADKYQARADEITVVAEALGIAAGTVELLLRRNLAMSSTLPRVEESALFLSQRQDQVVVDRVISVPVSTIDEFCVEHGISMDFLKLDTEGTELDILRGARQQLGDVLAVRSEVNFARTFEDAALFSEVHEFLLDNEFYLLNLDYNGRGDYVSELVDPTGRYGILINSDAVWMKEKQSVYRNPDTLDGQSLAIRILKYAAFCFNNHAADVAIDILLEARREHGAEYGELAHTRLYDFVDIALHRALYSLKWRPGQMLDDHRETYRSIFDRDMLDMHEYNHSLKLNPD
jgi:FkbM family methyltransferase